MLRSVDNREGGPEGEGGKGERKREEEEERGRRRSGWEGRQEQEEGAEGGERLRVPWRVSTRALHGMGGRKKAVWLTAQYAKQYLRDSFAF